MNTRQREFVSRYLADVSKGFLLSVAVGAATDKLSLMYLTLYLLLAGYAFLVAHLLERYRDDANSRIRVARARPFRDYDAYLFWFLLHELKKQRTRKPKD